MKKLLLLPLIALLGFVVSETNTIAKKERKFATSFLKETRSDLIKTVKGLSDAQLKFKATPDRWSVEECLKHIAVTEIALRQLLDGSLKQPANPGKRSEIKVTDDGAIKMMEDRTHKVQTTEQFQPQNTPFKSADEALSSFKENREKLIDFVKSTQDDLRAHVIDFPMGKVDGYQLILLISAHSNRHTQQIREVMADANFPKQ